MTQSTALLLTREVEAEPAAIRDVAAQLVRTMAERLDMAEDEAVHLVAPETVAEIIVAATEHEPGPTAPHAARPGRVDDHHVSRTAGPTSLAAVVGSPGRSESLTLGFGRRYAAALRLAVLVPVATIALLRSTAEYRTETTLILLVLAVESVLFTWWVLGGRGGCVVAADVLTVSAVCLSALWTEAAAQSNVGWLRLFVTFACVAYQWHTSIRAGAAATLVTGGSLYLVVAVESSGPVLAVDVLWVGVAALLSRTGWLIMLRRARAADLVVAQTERARLAQRIEEAVRAQGRELDNALHDTAASTLLMVGSGQVPAGATWLARQLQRDIDMLRDFGRQAPQHIDLVMTLRADVEAVRVHLPIDLETPAELLLPFSVGRALADAGREALNNVVRHAEAPHADVRLRGDSRRVVLDVVDEGRGFEPGDLSGVGRGVRQCIQGRMSRIGGTAEITSRRGVGTLVRLEWHRA